MRAGDPPRWLTLTGVNGCGKTMLMRQVFAQANAANPGNPASNPIWPPDWDTRPADGVHVYRSSRPYCVWFDERGLAARMRDGDFNLPASLAGDYFVALDEVGSARDPTNFVAQAVGDLCEHRLGRWTMFATNLTLAEIAERMDARIASRFVRDDNRVVEIRARDYAFRKSR